VLPLAFTQQPPRDAPARIRVAVRQLRLTGGCDPCRLVLSIRSRASGDPFVRFVPLAGITDRIQFATGSWFSRSARPRSWRARQRMSTFCRTAAAPRCGRWLESRRVRGSAGGLRYAGHSARLEQKSPVFRGFCKRMKGLEPSTFCMASLPGRYDSPVLRALRCSDVSPDTLRFAEVGTYFGTRFWVPNRISWPRDARRGAAA